MSTRAREQAAMQYEKAAQELEQAALHLRTAARHLRNDEVPRCGAHEWAARGHSRNASYLLDMLSQLHGVKVERRSEERACTPRRPGSRAGRE